MSANRNVIEDMNCLIAEFRPQTNKYYHYMSDQINSTRIVRDDSDNVVYS
ncbi:MAG: hypothetical protein NT166_09135 [Candidatus Aminicenantes bacterium]|nr:hypothetical protein [Candidatus Aminicenantes bacterium]